MKKLNPLALSLALLSSDAEALTISTGASLPKIDPIAIQIQRDLLKEALGSDFCNAGDAPNAEILESFCDSEVEAWTYREDLPSIMNAAADIDYCQMRRTDFFRVFNDQFNPDGETDLEDKSDELKCIHRLLESNLEEQAEKSARKFIESLKTQ